MADSQPPDVALAGDEAFWRVDLSNALLLVSAFLLGLYGVVRPVAFQWSPYSAESAMAGILASLFVLAAWGVGAVYRRRAAHVPDGVIAVVILWLGLQLVGLSRSPYQGAALPAATEAGIGVALLLGAFAVAKAWPGFVSVGVRLLVAGGVLEALLGFWQKFHDLPELRRLAEQKRLTMPDILFTQQGQERLYSEEIFGTFGNANSYAGFLLVTLFLQAGVWLDARRRGIRAEPAWQAGHAICFIAQLLALYISGSKGAWVAGVAGAWFVFIQLAGNTAARKRILGWVTGLGLTTLVGVLVLATAGPLRGLPFPLSLRIRFEYWMTGWGMIREQPWLGVGLGGFSEAYPQYKTAMATETMLAHNDYLQLWTEMGLLAPLIWLLLWFVILRPRAAAVDAAVPALEPQKTALTDEQVRTRVLGVLMLVGGLLGAVFMMISFGRMHGSYLNRFFDPEATGDVRGGVLAALITPVCYAGAFMLLGLPRSVAVSPPGSTLWIGVRAAAGAVLVHQLVDFDMTAQAIMSWLFLLGGFLLAQAPVDPQPGVLSRFARFAPPLLILLLLYGAVISPLFSGQARDSAFADEESLRDTRVMLQNVRLPEKERKDLNEKIDEVYVAMTRAREEAFRWAPHDGAAALDLSLAYLQLQRTGRFDWQPLSSSGTFPLTELEDNTLTETIRLRPRWHGAPLVNGHVLLERGMNALRKGQTRTAQDCFQKAEKLYRRALELYPLSPSHSLVVGDALLLQGKTKEAGACYSQAWEVDRRILDPNVRFSSIFHDPLPGCLVKHGRDPDIEERLIAALAKPGGSTELRRGLLVRQMLVAAWMLLGAPTERTTEIERFMSRIKLIRACEALTEIAPEDGHAAFFYALALKGYHKPELSPSQQLVRAQWEFAPLGTILPGDQAWSAAVAFALLREQLRTREPSKEAIRLQEESVRRGRPDTLPEVFEALRGRL